MFHDQTIRGDADRPGTLPVDYPELAGRVFIIRRNFGHRRQLVRQFSDALPFSISHEKTFAARDQPKTTVTRGAEQRNPLRLLDCGYANRLARGELPEFAQPPAIKRAVAVKRQIVEFAEALRVLRKSIH